MIRKNSDGAALVEYATLIGFISVLAISAVFGLGTNVKDGFDEVADTVVQMNDGTLAPGGGSNTGGSVDNSGSGESAGASAPAKPTGCQMLDRGVGEVTQNYYPGTYCFEFADDTFIGGYNFETGSIDSGDVMTTSTSNEDFTFISGVNGMDYQAGSGDDDAFYAMDECLTASVKLGSGFNRVIVTNQASEDAYFDSFMGDTFVGFADGSSLQLLDTVSEIHFTNASLDSAQITSRIANDPAAPNADHCGYFPGNNG